MTWGNIRDQVLDALQRRQQIEVKMVDTDKARQALAVQIDTGTHRPATQCRCGAWRTPGQRHERGRWSSNPAPRKLRRWCSR